MVHLSEAFERALLKLSRKYRDLRKYRDIHRAGSSDLVRKIVVCNETARSITDSASQLVLDDTCISKMHVRIYNIIYDANIEPFVYAHDLSRNGTQWLYKDGNHWIPYPIGKGNAFLLSDGDRIRFCDGTTFAFRSFSTAKRCGLAQDISSGQKSEQEVLWSPLPALTLPLTLGRQSGTCF